MDFCHAFQFLEPEIHIVLLRLNWGIWELRNLTSWLETEEKFSGIWERFKDWRFCWEKGVIECQFWDTLSPTFSVKKSCIISWCLLSCSHWYCSCYCIWLASSVQSWGSMSVADVLWGLLDILDNRRRTSFCWLVCRTLVWCLADFVSLIFHRVTKRSLFPKMKCQFFYAFSLGCWDVTS